MGLCSKMDQICNYLYNKKKFEIFKDERGEVRVKSNAVREVQLRVSITVFSRVTYFFYGKQKAKTKISPFHLQLLIQI